jgi:hypothetical protein
MRTVKLANARLVTATSASRRAGDHYSDVMPGTLISRTSELQPAPRASRSRSTQFGRGLIPQLRLLVDRPLRMSVSSPGEM